MLGSLVDVQTSDGIKLHGFYTHAVSRVRSERESTVWLIVHGVNGNFYGSTLLTDLAKSVQQVGDDAILVNTRGHDLATFGSADFPARMGSMFESIDDCRYDLKAWVAYCKGLGYRRIGLIAHSLGAVKGSYALAHHPLDIQRFIAVSPPRLNTELLMRDPAKWQVFSEQLEEAKKWCEQGIPHQIIRVRFPLPNWVSAATFLDKYGSGEKYDYFAWWSKIQVPVLWLFGEQEVRQGSVNFRDVDLALSQRFLDAGRAIDRNGAFHRVGASESSASIPGHDLVVIQNADHSYRKERDELSQAISRWILASENR